MIRQYCQDDLESIADLVEHFASESGCFEIVGGFSRSHFLKTLETLESFLRVWVRDSDGSVVSVLAMLEHDNPYSGKDCLEELFWFSYPSHRGHIENVSLLKAAESYARKTELCYLAMGSMVDFQPPKIDLFYQRRGFHLHQKQYFLAINS